MESVEDIARWTARGAFALYVLSLAMWINAGKNTQQLKLARALWTAACVAMLVHVGFAFDRVHHWSHDAAYSDTARQTADLFGLNWGGGLYANYALLLVWLVDVGWWWRGIEIYAARRKSITWGIHAFLAFMWFNATVVFGHGWFRWASLACFLILAGMLATTWTRSQNKTASAGNQRRQ